MLIPRLQYNDTDASSSSDRFLINGSYLFGGRDDVDRGHVLGAALGQVVRAA